jgi:SAM-dependent methyltransferase
MSIGIIEQARKTWDEIDIKKVRSVAWCSLSFIGRKVGHSLSAELGPDQYVHRLLEGRTEAHRRRELRGAALVCGDMASERGFFEVDGAVKFAEVEGYDISSVSLERYTPKNLRFEGRIADCNNLVLPRDTYDLIVGSHGIHHVYNLGNIFYQAHHALADSGLIYLYEWIGPEYLQFPRRNHIISVILLYLLFPSRRARTTHMGLTKGFRWIQSRPDQFDPSEACNTGELLPQFLKYFKPVKMSLHGGLMYPIFEGTAQNIDETKLLNKLKIRFVYYLETLLTKLRLVKPLFMMVVAEKRDLRAGS